MSAALRRIVARLNSRRASWFSPLAVHQRASSTWARAARSWIWAAPKSAATVAFDSIFPPPVVPLYANSCVPAPGMAS